MDIRYIIQNDSMKPSYPWCYICSFNSLENANEFIIREKKVNENLQYRIIRETTEIIKIK